MDRRTAVPLCALLSATALSTLLVVQTVLACTDKVALPVPGAAMAMMPGMDMSSMGDPPSGQMMMVCPVVLALIALSLLLTAAAIAMLCRDPHRSLALRAVVCSLAALPPMRTAAAVALASASAVAAMVRLDGMGPSGLGACAMVLGLLAVCSLSAALFAIVAGRVALEFSRRLILAIVAAVAHVAPAAAPRARFCPSAVTCSRDIAPLARGYGLRAPPSFVR
ncbi:MAG: hypothetical protein ABSH03_03530 [Candidatus Lustribacter sp.]